MDQCPFGGQHLVLLVLKWEKLIPMRCQCSKLGFWDFWSKTLIIWWFLFPTKNRSPRRVSGPAWTWTGSRWRLMGFFRAGPACCICAIRFRSDRTDHDRISKLKTTGWEGPQRAVPTLGLLRRDANESKLSQWEWFLFWQVIFRKSLNALVLGKIVFRKMIYQTFRIPWFNPLDHRYPLHWFLIPKLLLPEDLFHAP